MHRNTNAPHNRLNTIATSAEYAESLGRIDALMDAEMGTDDGDELDALVNLVIRYEAERLPAMGRGPVPDEEQ